MAFSYDLNVSFNTFRKLQKNILNTNNTMFPYIIVGLFGVTLITFFTAMIYITIKGNRRAKAKELERKRLIEEEKKVKIFRTPYD
jgi:hypothetical protein